MALKNGKPNPLNYFNMRRVEYPSPHLKYTVLEKYSPMLVKNIDAWIYQNLNHRYYIGQSISLDSSNNFIHVTKIGFESEKELSFFTIACPHLNMR